MNERLHIPTPASMLQRWQEEYAAAYGENRLQDMLRNAQRLHRLYEALGNSGLARRWTEEYIRCWSLRNEPPRDGDSSGPAAPEPVQGITLTMMPGRSC